MLFLTSFIFGFVILVPGLLAASLPPALDPHATIVNLRIEGSQKTIYEGPIITKGHNVTTSSGGTHHCDGTNNHENLTPGPTCTSSLDDASKLKGFTWDGSFFDEFDDYFITRIASDTGNDDVAWGILLDFEFTPVGGCQQRAKNGDHVLFAFDAFNKNHFLKLSGPTTVKAGHPVTFTVTDGATGVPIGGAIVAGGGTSEATNADGEIQLAFELVGPRSIKAERSDSIRSNKLSFLVVP